MLTLELRFRTTGDRNVADGTAQSGKSTGCSIEDGQPTDKKLVRLTRGVARHHGSVLERKAPVGLGGLPGGDDEGTQIGNHRSQKLGRMDAEDFEHAMGYESESQIRVHFPNPIGNQARNVLETLLQVVAMGRHVPALDGSGNDRVADWRDGVGGFSHPPQRRF